MNNSTSEILHYKNQIKNKINHTFLSKYIQKPVIDEDKIFILTKLIPLHGSLPEIDRDNHIITTMLVQVALDTHDLVPSENNPDETRDHLLKKQLHVLAGDYYSGLYYYLLAQTGDYKFINTLAVAIKQINEYKMKLYYQEYEDIQEYLDLKVHVASILIFSAAEGTEVNKFKEVLKEWLYIKYLFELRDDLDQREQSFLTGLDINTAKSNQLLNTKIQAFENRLENVSQEDLELKLYFTNKLEQYNHLITSSVEEG
ncbi:heptaprenyl diphosphate synthase component 1 [Oceanobacillus sp. CAU 1775]